MGEEASDALKGRAALRYVAQVLRGRPGRDQIPDDSNNRPHVATLKHVQVELPTSVELHGQDSEIHNWDALNPAASSGKPYLGETILPITLDRTGYGNTESRYSDLG